jgi:hypothetical protein
MEGETERNTATQANELSGWRKPFGPGPPVRYHIYLYVHLNDSIGSNVDHLQPTDLPHQLKCLLINFESHGDWRCALVKHQFPETTKKREQATNNSTFRARRAAS